MVFCHQEDSNWPLSDSSTLKKKFDDIFAATRYTKALESIKKLRKDQAAAVKLDEARLGETRAHREQALKCRHNVELYAAQCDELQRAREAAAAQVESTIAEHTRLQAVLGGGFAANAVSGVFSFWLQSTRAP